MAIALVQSAKVAGYSGSGTLALTFGSNITAGNAVIVCQFNNSTNGTAISPSSGSDSFTQDVTDSQYMSSIWHCFNSSGGYATLKIHGGVVSERVIAWAYEVSGIGALDLTSNGSSDSGATTFSSGATGTTTAAAEFWAGIGMGTGPTSTAAGPASVWTNEASQLQLIQGGPSGIYAAGVSGYQVTSSAGAATYSGTFGSSMLPVGACVATYKPATFTSTGSLSLSGMKMAGQGVFPSFPASPLGVTVEILLNGTWTNISAYVYQRDPIVITRGRPDETTAIQPASMNVTLNNRDFRFSPKYSGGAYYPYIGRNVQIRLSVHARSVDGVQYSGYRFWGEVSNWPPLWDKTGTDIYVQVQAGGIMRRYVQGHLLGSSLRRYYLLETGSIAPVSYWPCEDGTGATAFINLIVPGDDMAWTGSPTLASDSDFTGSDPLPLISQSAWTGLAATTSSPSNVVIRYLLDVPTTGAVDQAVLVRGVVASGSLTYIETYYQAANGGCVSFRGYNGATKEFDSGTSGPNNVNGLQLMVSMELATSGSNIAWKIETIEPGAASVYATDSGTYTTATLGAVSQIVVNPAGTINDTGIGHIVLQYALEALTSVSAAINGHNGELAANRFTRLCAEEGFGGTLIGFTTDTPMMGPQANQTFMTLMQQIEDADRGQIIEARDMLGLYYRTRINLQNQMVGLTLNYANAVLGSDPQIQPAYDDQLTRNNVSITRPNGSTVTMQLSSGALSVNDPPNGVGDYTYSDTIYVYADSQLTNLTTWILTVGTVDEYRYPQIPVDLSRTEAAVSGVFDKTPALDIGTFFEITNPPTQIPDSPVQQLAWGFTETLGPFGIWTIVINAVPESPYTGTGLPVW